jgi:hypothetical protein
MPWLYFNHFDVDGTYHFENTPDLNADTKDGIFLMDMDLVYSAPMILKLADGNFVVVTFSTGLFYERIYFKKAPSDIYANLRIVEYIPTIYNDLICLATIPERMMSIQEFLWSHRAIEIKYYNDGLYYVDQDGMLVMLYNDFPIYENMELSDTMNVYSQTAIVIAKTDNESFWFTTSRVGKIVSQSHPFTLDIFTSYAFINPPQSLMSRRSTSGIGIVGTIITKLSDESLSLKNYTHYIDSNEKYSIVWDQYHNKPLFVVNEFDSLVYDISKDRILIQTEFKVDYWHYIGPFEGMYQRFIVRTSDEVPGIISYEDINTVAFYPKDLPADKLTKIYFMTKTFIYENDKIVQTSLVEPDPKFIKIIRSWYRNTSRQLLYDEIMKMYGFTV